MYYDRGYSMGIAGNLIEVVLTCVGDGDSNAFAIYWECIADAGSSTISA